MSTVILRGEAAIHFAQAHQLTLNEDATEEHGPRHGISVDEARRIQDAHSGHVWVQIEWGVNSGEYTHH